LVYDGFISYGHAADDLLAPRLQAGLQRFAKPWWKRRALRIFRDESSLSANPHLWSSITDALDGSGWFVLLLSPEGAASEWVNREVEYWLEHKDPDRIIPVLTDGDFGWADSDIVSDAVPSALQGAFSDEPRWVDLRFARTEEQLDLNNPTFSAAVADIASAIRDVPKDELESEEVRQHRRTVRTAWAAATGLLLLALLAGAAALFALDQRDDARAATAGEAEQRQLAEENAEEADRQRGAAVAAADAEAAARQEAERNADLARSRELSASAINVLDEDAELSVLLALAAAETDDPPLEATSALHEALSQHRVIHTYSFPEDHFSHTDLHPSGRYLVAGGFGPSLEVWDMEEDVVLWSKEWENTGVSNQPYFTASGDEITSSVAYWPVSGEETNPPLADELGVFVWDAMTGDVVTRFDTGPCGAIFNGMVSGSRPSTRAIVATPTGTECDFSGEIAMQLLDLTTGDMQLLTTFTFRGQPIGNAVSADGRVIAFDDGSAAHVVDATTGEELLTITSEDLQRVAEEYGFLNWTYVRALDPTGERLLFGDRPILVWDVATGEVIASFDEHDGETFGGAFFSPDGSVAISAGRDGTTRIWDPSTGSELDVLGGAGFAFTPAMSHDGSLLLVADETSAVARLWDLNAVAGAEVAAIETCSGFMTADSLQVAQDRAVVSIYCGDDLFGNAPIIDLNSMDVERQLPPGDGQMTALSPDGSSVAQLDGSNATLAGPIRIYDADTAESATTLDAVCVWDTSLPIGEQPQCVEPPDTPFQFWPRMLDFSADSALLAGLSNAGSVTVWDAATGELVHIHNLPRDPLLGDPSDVRFFGGGSRLLVVYGSLTYQILDTNTWQVIETVELSEENPAVHRGVFSHDDAYLVGAAGGVGSGDLTWHDTSTWQPVRAVSEPHRGTIKDIDISPAETLVATGGSDGFIRIWDFETAALVHQIPIGSGQVQNVAFITDTHLLVTPEDGNILVVTIDVAELIDIARERVTRGFSETECETYRIEPCLTLEEIKN
jgi:WD40 repeat protein